MNEWLAHCLSVTYEPAETGTRIDCLREGRQLTGTGHRLCC